MSATSPISGDNSDSAPLGSGARRRTFFSNSNHNE
jgi:hypothetical protein